MGILCCDLFSSLKVEAYSRDKYRSIADMRYKHIIPVSVIRLS
jgi:hypothetical protein